MASTIALRRRINSIRGTRQITKALELVAGSKLRRAIAQAQASRDYRQAAYELLAQLNTIKEVETQPLFRQRPIKKRLYVVVTSNSGLAGAYNINVLKLLTKSVKQDKMESFKSIVITIGNKGAQFVRRLADVELLAHYPAFGDHPTQGDIQPILRSLVEQYVDTKVDEVIILYTVFRSSIIQNAANLPLLPAKLEKNEKNESPANLVMNFEPDVETVIHQIATRLIEVQIWQALLEGLASELSMRMLAMKNATDNANDLIDDYTLEYNTARQSQVTQELAEITGGAEALREV
jgi:F-type H+-transporting ATPase subunit gamma